MSTNKWLWTEYSNDIVIYIAGSIIRTIKKKIKCEMCVDQLQNNVITSSLIGIKNRAPLKTTTTNCQNQMRGLISPSNDVIVICKTAEKVLRSTPNLFTKNVLQKLMIHANKLLLEVKLFSRMDMFMEDKVLSSHKSNLINLILKQYFYIRLHHEAKSSQNAVQRIRSFHNRLVLFKNQ